MTIVRSFKNEAIPAFTINSNYGGTSIIGQGAFSRMVMPT
jgi:hypothetical protein